MFVVSCLETMFVPLDFAKYLRANVLRSERVVDRDELWYDTTVPSLIGKHFFVCAGCKKMPP